MLSFCDKLLTLGWFRFLRYWDRWQNEHEGVLCCMVSLEKKRWFVFQYSDQNWLKITSITRFWLESAEHNNGGGISDLVYSRDVMHYVGTEKLRLIRGNNKKNYVIPQKALKGKQRLFQPGEDTSQANSEFSRLLVSGRPFLWTFF